MIRGNGRFLLGLLGAIAFVYAPGLPGPPMMDDGTGVLRNPVVGDLRRLPGRFLDPVPQQPPGVPLPCYVYRPLAEASFALQRALGADIHGFRLGNLLLHAACALLVFLVVRRFATLLPESPLSPRWAALLFALHPLAVQAVTYVYQRAVLLETLLCLLTLLLYLVARAHPRPFRSAAYWAALASGLLAMTAKETAVTLPLTLAALAWILREPGSPWKPTLSRWLPFALLPALVLVQVVRAGSLAGDLGARTGNLTSSAYTPLQYLLVEIPVLGRYLRLAALPFPLTFYYDRLDPLEDQPLQIPWMTTLACGAALIALLAWILLGARRHRVLRLALALFLAPLALESSVFPLLDIGWNYRCYPSLLGAGLLLAWVLGRLPRLKLLAAGTLLLLATLSLSEVRRWTDPLSLERRDVRHAWHVTTTWARYGWRQFEVGRPERAAPAFARAFLSPWFDIRVCEGYIRAVGALDRREEARRILRQTLSMFPDDMQLLALAIQASEEDGDREALERLVRRLEALPILNPKLVCWLAGHRAGQGRLEEAGDLLDRYLPLYAGFPAVWIERGNVFLQQESPAEAETAYRKALALDPGLDQVLNTVGLLRARQGDWPGAEAAFREALLRNPDNRDAQENLDKVRARR